MKAFSRYTFCLALAALGFASFSRGHAESLVSYDTITPAGLERSWFGQVQLDVTRDRVRSWRLFEDNLLALTNTGTLHSFNAETGETLWVTQVGVTDQAAVGPAASKTHVAVISGSVLHVFDRATGRQLWAQGVGGAPAAGPALSDDYVYVPLFNGRIEAYKLDDPKALNPWYSQSIGRIFHSPTASSQVVTWPTDRGYLYVGKASPPGVLYRIETDSPATAPPTGVDPYLYVQTADGHAYCFDELTGAEVWRYAMGFNSTTRAAVVGDRVYVASSEPMLHAINSKTGEGIWSFPGIEQFVAQGAKQVYGLDDLGRLVIVDRETGKFVGQLPGLNYKAVFNEQSDRVFLVNDKGLVQALHEIGAVEPTMYRELPAEEEKAEEAPVAEEGATPFVDEPAEESTTPFGEEPAAEEEDTPFDEEETEDAGNPFDF
jgi:outer membrane protein assembly factor BamB